MKMRTARPEEGSVMPSISDVTYCYSIVATNSEYESTVI